MDNPRGQAEGRRKKKHKERATRNKIRPTQGTAKAYIHKEADRTVKQLTQHDKRKYLEDMATKAEEAPHIGD